MYYIGTKPEIKSPMQLCTLILIHTSFVLAKYYWCDDWCDDLKSLAQALAKLHMYSVIIDKRSDFVHVENLVGMDRAKFSTQLA